MINSSTCRTNRKERRSVSAGNLSRNILSELAPFVDRDSLNEIVNNMIDNAKKPDI
jgi:hypothetical protein